MRKFPSFALMFAGAAVVLAACAPAVQPADPFMDARLNCSELAVEITRTRELRAEAQSNKGMSGQNVAWAIFFWPAIFANESNNTEAIRAADDRLRYLYTYYNDRECTTLGLLGPVESTGPVVAPVPTGSN